MREYLFYGLLNVRLETRHRGWIDYFDNEYDRIADPTASASEARVTIDVKLVDRLPEREDGDVVREERFKGLFRYASLVRGIDTAHVTVYFRHHWIDRVYMNAIGVYLQAQILEPVMYAKLLGLDVLLMHAGGVASDEKGFLLPAYGGTGKTTLSMALMATGYRLLGDDLLFVETRTGIVHPYPRPLHIFTYNVDNLIGAKVPFKYRVAVRTKNILRFFLEGILRREFLISTRIHADELYEGDVFAHAVPYTAVAFLRKEGDAIEAVEIGDDNVEDIARQIASSEDLNDSLWALLGDSPLVAAFQAEELRVITTLLRQFRAIAFVNTRQMDLTQPNDLVELLESDQRLLPA
ncbi:hypothetical protein [Agromyces sp. SYSU T00194]|uniref:hypothetical protein n=1 Tax=Agromyces chitinivorans TaxID=3158560 RepID=UPI00339B667A